jgi:hypothetical protein
MHSRSLREFSAQSHDLHPESAQVGADLLPAHVYVLGPQEASDTKRAIPPICDSADSMYPTAD